MTSSASAIRTVPVRVTWRWTIYNPRWVLFMVALSVGVVRGDFNAPFWLSLPVTNAVSKDARVTFRAVAAGQDVRYMWLSNGVVIQGVTAPALSLTATEGVAAARFAVVASNSFGMSTNGIFQLRIASGATSLYPRGKAREPWTGSPDVLDLLAIGNHIRSMPPLSGLGLVLADVDGNGTVNRADQILVQDAILGRTNLGVVSKLATDDANRNGLPDYLDWLFGLSPGTSDADGDGISDGIEVRDGTDPLDPRSFIPYGGLFMASPQTMVLLAGPDPVEVGLFIATPPTVVVLGRDGFNDSGLFASTPSVSVLAAWPDQINAGLFAATPSTTAILATSDPSDAGIFASTPSSFVLIAYPDPRDSGLFEATPSTVVVLATEEAGDTGLFAAIPPATVLALWPDAGDAGLHQATPPASLVLRGTSMDDMGVFVGTPPTLVRLRP